MENRTDWSLICLVIYGLVCLLSVIGYIWGVETHSVFVLKVKELITQESEPIKSILVLFGGFGFAINAYFSARRSVAMEKSAEAANKNAEALTKSIEVASKNAEANFKNIEISLRSQEIAEDKQITERFSKAIEQLGSDKMEVRLGAIYTLERIANDSVKDHWTIVEIITAFIRQNCPIKAKSDNTEKSNNTEINNIKIDIQAALTVIERRNRESEKERQILDLHGISVSYAKLSGADLSGADLSKANLSQANLHKANLSQANLYKANLSQADLLVANLTGANLSLADLSESILLVANLSVANLSVANLSESVLSESVLFEANLTGANLTGANLTGANLTGANLTGANLTGANLTGANLTGARNINFGNIKLAENWEQAYYDPEIRRQLGLPDEVEG